MDKKDMVQSDMSQKKTTRIILRLLTAAFILCWMLVIGSFSAQQGTESSGLSKKAASLLVTAEERLFHRDFTEEQRLERIEALQFPIRKLAHMTEYGILAVLFVLHLGTYGWKSRNYLPAAWLCTTAYAALDEIHQLFVPGRSGRFVDVCIDGAGALIGIGLFWLIARIWGCRRKDIGSCIVTGKGEENI